MIESYIFPYTLHGTVQSVIYRGYISVRESVTVSFWQEHFYHSIVISDSKIVFRRTGYRLSTSKDSIRTAVSDATSLNF